MQPYYKTKYGFKKKNFPNSIKFYQNEISLPIYYDLDLKKLIYIKKVLKKIFKNNSPPILYGGSVDENNIQVFKQIKQIDGFLIGGASKSSKKFIDIIKNYYR